MMRNSILIIICLFFLLKTTHAQEDLKVGVVLSGGGAKGYAHIGVLEVLEEAGVKVDYIGGTSMGAIIGALYASGYNADQMRELIKNIDINQAVFDDVNREMTPFFSKVHEEKYILTLEFDNLKLQLPKAISDGQGTLNILTEYLAHVHDITAFDELPTPFLCIATDIETGEQKIFERGFLPNVIMASGAYPTLFKPVEIDGHYYVDGGVVNNFPAEEVRKMGADYIIGVDLAAGLSDYEDMTNATGIIEQIISFQIESKTDQQRKLVDLLIVPDVKKISVTNFELKDSIMQEGYKAAIKLKPTLDSIQKRQSSQPYIKPPIEQDSVFIVRDIKVNGLENYSKGYVMGKMKIEPESSVTYNDLIEGISYLYATENFTSINHKLHAHEDGAMDLILDINEKKNKYYLRFGLHYDELFKSSLLANFTAKNLLTINSTLSIDAIFGDNPRYNVNYFVDNGIRPSFGFNSSYYGFDIEQLNAVDDNNNELSYNYNFNNFVNQLYTQSTIAEKYAGGLGVEYNYLKIYTKNLEPSNPLRNIQNASFIIPYAFIKADNRNNSFFPSRGLYLDSQFRYFLHSSADDFAKSSLLKTYVEYNQNIVAGLSVQGSATLGLSFDRTLPLGYNFLLGGQNQQDLVNSYNFYGAPFAAYSGSNLLGVGAAMQYGLDEKHFLRYNFNAAHLSNKFELNEFLNFEYTGHGLTYGYLSPLGPLQGSLGYSPNFDKVVVYVSLGYWF